jgi:putative oxidoreductase
MKRISFSDIISILLLLLFIYTAVSKFLDYDKFVFQMKLAPLPFMHLAAPILGRLVPSVEMLLVITLFFGIMESKYQPIGIYASLILLLSFEVYISGMLFSGMKLPCTCGGIISKMSWNQHLVFNGIFIILSAMAIATTKKIKNKSISQVL